VQKGGGVAPDLVKALDDQGLRTPADAAGWGDAASRFERVAQRAQREGDFKAADHYFKLAEQSNEMAERLETDSGKVHGAPKFSTYQLPGGENYREVLLTLPEAKGKTQSYYIAYRDGPTLGSGFDSEAAARAALAETFGSRADLEIRPGVGERAAIKTGFRSQHWEEPNVLAHIRLNDRTDADGKRVLFVEEIQSDWAQKGRKEGFAGGAVDTERRALLNEANAALPYPTAERMAQIQARLAELADGNRSPSAVPTAPFVTKTEAWTALAIKRIVKLAADEGYDRVAFINGEQSAERYDLSKQVGAIEYERTNEGKYELIARAKDSDAELFQEDEISIERVEELVGKDIAKKIAAGEGRKPQGGGYRDWRVLEGIDLKVGGEGMRAFYDKIVPNVAKDVLRKLGGEGLTNVPVSATRRIHVLMHDDGFIVKEHGDSGNYGIFKTSLEAEKKADQVRNATKMLTQPGFDITPKMRESAAGGVPLFKGPAPSTGAKPVGSPEALDTLLREKFGSKLIEGLHEQGILKYALARDEGQTGTRSGTKAVLRQKPGEKPAATLYFDRLTPEQAPAALLHELGEHFGIVRVLGTERYNVMLNELRGLRDTPEVAEAWKHVERNYVGENTAAKLKNTDDPVFIREVAAKLVEDHPDLPFVRRLVNEIRAFLYEHFGTTLGNRVDANLIRGMAASALRKAAKGDLPATPPVKTFRPLVRTSRAAEPRAQP